MDIRMMREKTGKKKEKGSNPEKGAQRKKIRVGFSSRSLRVLECCSIPPDRTGLTHERHFSSAHKCSTGLRSGLGDDHSKTLTCPYNHRPSGKPDCVQAFLS